jgi:copper chaperone CopZ
MGTETVVLAVQGMDCAGCEEAIGRAVGRLPGVASCRASHAEGRVEVAFDPALVDRDALARAVEEAGFEVVG